MVNGTQRLCQTATAMRVRGRWVLAPQLLVRCYVLVCTSDCVLRCVRISCGTSASVRVMKCGGGLVFWCLLFCVVFIFIALEGEQAVTSSNRNSYKRRSKGAAICTCLKTTPSALSSVGRGADARQTPDLDRTIAHVPPPCRPEALCVSWFHVRATRRSFRANNSQSMTGQGSTVHNQSRTR